MTISTLYTMHAVDDAKLVSVVGDMKKLGAPTVRVVDCGEYFVAIEGTHRVAAAAKLGLPVCFDILGQDDLVASHSLDWQDLPSGDYTAGELAGEAFSPQSGTYKINDDDTVYAI